MRSLLLMLAMLGTVHADDAMTGFTTFGAGTMTGRVTGADGKPLANVAVHVVSNRGESVVTADRDGAYRVELAGQTMIYVDLRGARLGGESAQSVKVDGAEAIEIRATVPPKTLAVPKSDPNKIPEYTDAAINSDAWLRAWVMLDIDATGAVRHVKFLNRPGFDLEPIVQRDGLALRFTPARDTAGKPMRSLMVWPFEWPSYSWLRWHYGRIKPDTVLPPCSTTHQRDTRDCTGPDLARAFSEPWMH